MYVCVYVFLHGCMYLFYYAFSFSHADKPLLFFYWFVTTNTTVCVWVRKGSGYGCIHAYKPLYIHLNIHTCIQTRIQTCIQTRIHTFIQTRIHTCIQTRIHTCIQTRIHTCIQASIHTCIQARIHTCIQACIHKFK